MSIVQPRMALANGHPATTAPLTDLGNGQRLVARHGHALRYVEAWGKWLTWDGQRWTESQTAAHALAKETALSILAEAANCDDKTKRHDVIKHAEASQSAPRINAMLTMARSEPGMLVEVKQLDADPWTLNCENGMLDLRTGSLRKHLPERLLTKLCPVAYRADATCPTWLAFLETIFAGDAELISFAQRLLGYGITGSVQEHCLPILHGSGCNGKSTLVGAVLEMLGDDYGMKAPPDLLMAKSRDAHPTAIADLHGKRLVACVESDDGRRLAESLVKELTGGDHLRARKMHQDYWQFFPTHKILLATNHRPEIRGTDHAIWRRLALVPFTVTIPDDQQDKQLAAKLRAELPGILAWAVEGCIAWQRHGLNPPGAVTGATASYRVDQDVIGAFLAECCVIAPHATAKASELSKAYGQWCDANGERTMSQTRLGNALGERGFAKRKSNGVVYDGIGLKVERLE